MNSDKNFARFININGKYRFFNDDSDLIKIYQEELDQLTNNWNELEEWVESNLGNCRTNIKYEIGNEYIIKENVYYKVLDKMKEIKENNNVSSRD